MLYLNTNIIFIYIIILFAHIYNLYCCIFVYELAKRNKILFFKNNFFLIRNLFLTVLKIPRTTLGS